MATKPRTILTPGDSAAPAQPVDATQPSVEPTTDDADAPSDQDVMRQRVAETVFTFPDPEPAKNTDPAPAAPAQPVAQVVSNTPKLTPDGWVVPADFGAQPKRIG